ncbi:MAG: BREX-1 system adenine-specific DNA-methyltransferase PglX [Chloroflexota bacterium]|nr:BREX-1 system adenine-specific DNA-methyltransferase PglX [Chloroflexota bacterium]
MPPLPSDQRRQLESAVIAARKAAEAAARVALETLAVERDEPFSTMGESARTLRRALRARARQLGDGIFRDGLPLLVEEVAYEQWHRMLFARFLAENGLLRHSSGVPVTLQDCAELAEEEGSDAWELAARYAGAMLPGLFRADDPAVRIRFAPEGRAALEGILAGLPASTFVADDTLGWVYQFWQKEKKDEVNKSGRKIGGADLSPVTQLFTETTWSAFSLRTASAPGGRPATPTVRCSRSGSTSGSTTTTPRPLAASRVGRRAPPRSR